MQFLLFTLDKKKNNNSSYNLTLQFKIAVMSFRIQELYAIWEQSNFTLSTDTRNIDSNCIFFCLKGEKYDANLFAEQAKDAGAFCVVTNRTDLQGKDGFFYTENTLTTLQALSKLHANKMNAKKIIIGGSNGKTTTKELIANALQNFGKTHFTQGNFNNHIGVPLTLLGIKPDHQFAVIELGTNHPGEMEVLCNLVDADVGVITNIGKEHLEGFGDIESVAKEESEVFQAIIKSGGIGIVNMDDNWLHSMSKRLSKSIAIGLKNPNHLSINGIWAEVIEEMPNLKLTLFDCGSNGNSEQIILENQGFEIAGKYNTYNILFALATLKALQLDLHTALPSIISYRPTNNRSEWRKLGNTAIFLDAYNANPSSMEAALRSFSTLKGSKAIFLGDMLELGSYADIEHKYILNLVIELGLESSTYLVGEQFYQSCSDFHMRFERVDSLLAWLDTHPIKDIDFAFIKGSRGVKMERTLEHFQS